MTHSLPDYAVFKLTGADRAAAIELLVREHELVKEHPTVYNNKNKFLTSKQHNLLARDIMDKLKAKKPDLVSQLGLDKGAVQIITQQDAHPRAYEQFPHITTSVHDGEIEDVFMFCPLDYKGEHHTPAHGRAVPASDLVQTDFGDIVYQRCTSIGHPYLTSNDRGTKMPADFDASKHRSRETGLAHEGRLKVFIAGGTSLACVEEYLARQAAMDKAIKDTILAVNAAAASIPADKILGAKGAALKSSAFMQSGADGKTEVWITATAGDRSVMIKDNDHFTIADYNGGQFKIEPNKTTKEGRELAKLFSEIRSTPSLGAYWQLFNPTAPKALKSHFNTQTYEQLRVPRLETIRGVHYLTYMVDDKAARDACNPPGSIPVNTAEFLWLKADIEDEDKCIRPAEPPQALQHLRPVRSAPAPK